MHGTARTHQAVLGALAVLAAFALAAGCGGRTSQFGGSCSAPSPCGGDPVGTWETTSACSVGDRVESTCEGAYVVVTSIRATGTLDIQDDGTWTSETTGTESATSFFPTDCVDDCLGREDIIATNSAVTDVACTEQDDGCACKFTLDVDTGLQQSSYSFSSDTTVQVSASGLPSVEFAYCVDGDTLTLEANGIVQRFVRR